MKKVAYEVEFEYDVDRAARIADLLYRQFDGRTGFSEGYVMPEYIAPRGVDRGSLEYALYLTYVISIDCFTLVVTA